MEEELIKRMVYLLDTVKTVPYLWGSMKEWRDAVNDKIQFIKSKIK